MKEHEYGSVNERGVGANQPAVWHSPYVGEGTPWLCLSQSGRNGVFCAV